MFKHIHNHFTGTLKEFLLGKHILTEFLLFFFGKSVIRLVQVNTEKNQTGINSDITMDNIYNAIRYLNPKEQLKIIENYKFTELYSILADKEEFEKYISYLRNISHQPDSTNPVHSIFSCVFIKLVFAALNLVPL